MSLRELYQEMIIDHGRQPRNFGGLKDASHSQTGLNPLCGDKLVLHLNIVDDKVKEARFEGVGCAISMASASLMTEALKGKTLLEVDKLFSAFHRLVTSGEKDEMCLGKLTILGGVIEFPMRVKCATLAWHTLKAALQHEKTIVSTEEVNDGT